MVAICSARQRRSSTLQRGDSVEGKGSTPENTDTSTHNVHICLNHLFGEADLINVELLHADPISLLLVPAV